MKQPIFIHAEVELFFIFYWRVHLIVLQVESIVQVNTVFTFFWVQKNFTLVAETRARTVTFFKIHAV